VHADHVLHCEDQADVWVTALKASRPARSEVMPVEVRPTAYRLL